MFNGVSPNPVKKDELQNILAEAREYNSGNAPPSDPRTTPNLIVMSLVI